jgi:hypothetical protein
MVFQSCRDTYLMVLPRLLALICFETNPKYRPTLHQNIANEQNTYGSLNYAIVISSLLLFPHL